MSLLISCPPEVALEDKHAVTKLASTVATELVSHDRNI